MAHSLDRDRAVHADGGGHAVGDEPPVASRERQAHGPPHQPTLFDSFFLGGFECGTQRRHDGRRLDLIAATGHDRWAEHDYRRMREHGLRSVRDGMRWHLIETRPGHYDFSSLLPMLDAAERSGVQVIWDLCHYGWPDDIDIWRPQFVERFAAFAGAVARLLRERSDAVPFYCVVNEVSYWSWAGGDQALMNPLARGRGFELKIQLTRAAIAATHAIRAVDPRARFVHVDPLIHVVAGEPGLADEAAAYLRAQHDSWLLMTGELWPGLGGDPSLIDIVGVNYYSNNQWVIGGPEPGRTVWRGEPDHQPLRSLLAGAAKRLQRPLLISETGAEGAQRGDWLRYVGEEVAAALAAGVPIEGVCLYPVLDYPGWADERHCETGLFGLADASGHRPLHPPMADALAWAQQHVQAVLHDGAAHPTEPRA